MQFSASPEHSSTKFRQRMAARKRATLETDRRANLLSRRQSKKRTEYRKATRQRLQEIQNERQRLRNMIEDNENRLNENTKINNTNLASTVNSKYTRKKTTTTTTTTTNNTTYNNTTNNNNSNKLPILKANKYRSRSSTVRRSSSIKEISQRPADLSSPGNHRNYKRVRNLGRGSFGAVTAAKNLNDGKIYAIKAIAYRGTLTVDKDRERALKEVKALRQLSDHPCVVGLRDAFESSCKRKLFIVAEYCESGSLHDRLTSARRSVERNGFSSGKLEAKLVSSWMFQLVAAIEHIHSRNTLHRDIKPGNIFLCAGATQVKLGDFGLVGVLENSMDVANSHVGTPTYNMTPELLKTGGASKPADMWSVGAVLHECLTLEQPFTQKGRGVDSIVLLGHAILNDEIDGHDRLAAYPSGLREICSHRCCMAKDPTMRPTASELLESSFMLRSMKMFLSMKHITPPPPDLHRLVKSKVLLGEASKVASDLSFMSQVNKATAATGRRQKKSNEVVH